MFFIKFADGWIRTRGFWCQKRSLRRLSNNHWTLESPSIVSLYLILLEHTFGSYLPTRPPLWNAFIDVTFYTTCHSGKCLKSYPVGSFFSLTKAVYLLIQSRYNLSVTLSYTLKYFTFCVLFFFFSVPSSHPQSFLYLLVSFANLTLSLSSISLILLVYLSVNAPISL